MTRTRFRANAAFWLSFATFAVTAQPAAAAQYSVISETTSKVPVPLLGELKLTNTVIQEGATPLNRFTMHRLRRMSGPVRGTVLLLPALGNSFQSYLFSEDGDLAHSFAAVFALLGYEVWGYSPRETGLAAGTCGVTIHCSAALNWSVQTIMNDVSYIRARIAAVAPGKSPVIGGLSLGALSALAVINQDPEAYSGLLAWEGSPVTDDVAIRAHNAPFCAQFTGLVSAGIPVDDQSLPFVKTVAQLARTAPDSPFVIPVPGFPPGLTNRQALVLILSAPNPIAPSPRPSFITAAGDFTSGSLFYSSLNRPAGNIATFNDVTASHVSRDFYWMSCQRNSGQNRLRLPPTMRSRTLTTSGQTRSGNAPSANIAQVFSFSVKARHQITRSTTSVISSC